MQRFTLRLIVAVLMAGLLTSRAGAGMIFISGEISHGTGKLVISDDLVFDMTTNSDPFMMTLEWETGLGTARWPNLSSDSDLVATTGGTLEIDANIPWSDEPFVHNVGSTNDRSDTLSSGPLLLGTGTKTRIYFSDTFQRVRALYQGGRDQMIIRAGEFELPEIPGFVLPETHAESVVLSRWGGPGWYPDASETILLNAVPEPSSLAVFAVLGLYAGVRRRRR